MKRKTKIAIIIIIIFIIGWIISWIPVTETITLDIDKVDGDGFRIVLISDLHSSYYGNNQKDLIKMVDDANPDIDLLAGDIFDDDLKKINAEIATRELADKYDCYYVTGNHEYWSGDVPQIKDYLRGIDITVLEGDCSHIKVNGIEVDLCGIDDPTRLADSTWKAQLDKATEGWTPEKAAETVISNNYYSFDELQQVADDVLESPKNMLELIKSSGTATMTTANLSVPETSGAIEDKSAPVTMDDTDEDDDIGGLDFDE